MTPTPNADMILLRGLDHRIYRAAIPPFREMLHWSAREPPATPDEMPRTAGDLWRIYTGHFVVESLGFGIRYRGDVVPVLFSRYRDGTFTAEAAGWEGNTFCAYGAAQSWVMHHVMRLPPEPFLPPRTREQEGWYNPDPAGGPEGVRAVLHHNRKVAAAQQAVREAVDRVLNLRPVPGDAEAIKHARYLHLPWAVLEKLEKVEAEGKRTAPATTRTRPGRKGPSTRRT